MGKKGTKRRGGGKKRRYRVAGRYLSLTAIIWIAWILYLMGVLRRATFDALMRGDIGGAIVQIEISIQSLATAGGMSVALMGTIVLGIATWAMHRAAKGAKLNFSGAKGLSV